jgi:hypothetical protein
MAWPVVVSYYFGLYNIEQQYGWYYLLLPGPRAVQCSTAAAITTSLRKEHITSSHHLIICSYHLGTCCYDLVICSHHLLTSSS